MSNAWDNESKLGETPPPAPEAKTEKTDEHADRHWLPSWPPKPEPPEAQEAFGGSGVAAVELDEATLREHIVARLKTVYDPEIPVNIYDLGLIYDLVIEAQGKVEIKMTLTAPACPV